jgi:signal transduction histidine kinase
MRSLAAPERPLVPYAILAIALLLTAAAGVYTYMTLTERLDSRFVATAERMSVTVDNRIDSYIAMLYGGAGLFAASDDVTFSEFRAYVDRLEVSRRYPGIQGIGFTRLVTPDEREAVAASIRRYVPSYHFWPDRPKETVEAIVYLEPQDERNLRAMGYDMSSEPNRRAAMERARDTAAAAATGRVRLVQEIDQETAQSGFLVYVPVFRGGSIPSTVEERRRLIYGFVYSPFRAGDLLKQILDYADVQRMEVSAYAGDGPPTEENWLYTSAPLGERTRYQVSKSFEVAGEPWVLLLRAGSSFTGTARRTATTAVVIVGIVLSSLLFAISMTQSRARAGAERIAEELRRSEEALRAANRSKDEFLAVVSHELRTPLNAIIGWAAMLRRGQVAPERHPHALQVIERNAHAQARLVEDLLDISRAVAGRLRLEAGDVDVTSTLHATVDALRPTASEQSVEIVLQASAGLGTITADQSRLQQIVQNLVGNAIKFTPSGGKVTLAAARDDERITIRVIDTGIGIRREFLPFAFDRFRQADTSTTRSHGGIGLGLAIVRHLVELHGGTIDVSSDGENLGSTFTVRVPVTPDLNRTSL